MKLRIATCTTLPEPDVDAALLLEALRVRGVDARMVAWEADGWADRKFKRPFGATSTLRPSGPAARRDATWAGDGHAS